MAFTQRTLPDSGTPGVLHHNGSRWLVFDEWNWDRIQLTDDWATYTTTLTSSISMSYAPTGIAWGGGSWWMVSSNETGLWKSTDGATGSTWAKTTPDFSSSFLGSSQDLRAKKIVVTSTGRLVVFGRYGIGYSDDSGSTWTHATNLLVSSIGSYGGGLRVYGSTLVAWDDSVSTFMYSSDNGSTWTDVTTDTMNGNISGVAKYGTTWVIACDGGDDIPMVSTNNGATWADIPGFASDLFALYSDGSTTALLRENSPNIEVHTSTDLATWTALDGTGILGDTFNGGAIPVYVSGTSIALAAPSISTDPGIYTASITGSTPLEAFIEIDSALGSMSILGFNDFSIAMVSPNAAQYYACDLLGDGVFVARLPISSWQATLQTGRSSYVQAVIPGAADYAELLQSATNATFVIYRGIRMSDGALLEQEMARAPLDTIQLAHGISRYTASISGFTTDFLTASTDVTRTLTDTRTIFSGSGGMRVRCGVDWLLRPGMNATVAGQTFTVAYINYYVGNGDAYMDVGERAL